EVPDAQAHHRPGGEEGVEFIGRTVDLEHRAVAQPEPSHAAGFPGERHADDVPKQPYHLAELVAAQPYEVHPFYCHSHSFGQQCGENGPMIVSRVTYLTAQSRRFSPRCQSVPASAKPASRSASMCVVSSRVAQP